MKKYFLLFLYIAIAAIIGEILGWFFRGAPILGAISWTFMWIEYLWYIRIPIILIYGLINIGIYAILEKIIQSDKYKKYFYPHFCQLNIFLSIL